MKQEDIAVVGIGALFPGAVDKYGFWQNIVAANDHITDVPDSHWLIEDYYDPDPAAPDKTYANRGGFLAETEFDPLQFSIPPANLKATDTSQLLALIVAQKVLEDACGGQFNRIDRNKASVILGVASATDLVVHLGSRMGRPLWAKALRDNGYGEREAAKICDDIADLYVPWQESSFPGLLGNVVAGRIANHFDLHGTNTVLDAACASSLSAVSLAVMELQSGRSDLVITGGVDTLNDIWMYMCFSKTGALSLSGDCRPFSDRADGTLLGEGIGMLALKRLSDAESDGDRIYAVIKGVGTSSDGKFKSIYAPRSEGQALALSRAYEQAGYDPQTVELVEAHGTGTKAGDIAEFAGLSAVFQEGGERQRCALGSIKSQIGHTKAAAGAAGLFKAIMALHHKLLPPTIKVDAPNPRLQIEQSPFYLNTASRPWIRGGDFPRRASVSAFGFGGSNFHVTLQEYTNEALRHDKWRALPAELFLFAAGTAEQLLERLQRFAGEIASCSPRHTEAHAFFAKQSQLTFAYDAAYRAAVIAADLADLAGKLDTAMARIRARPDQAIRNSDGICYDTRTLAGKIAFLFPGQGSQYVNMGKEPAMFFDPVREVWDRSAELPVDSAGAYAASALHRFVFPPPAFDEETRQRQSRMLTDTRVAQPAIGTMGLSMVNLLRKLGLQADCLCGHSYGEITALAAAGVLTERDMLSVAHQRGQLMHHAAEAYPGAMTAVMAAAETVQQTIDASGLDVAIANYNSPEQVVVSGQAADIAQLEQQWSRSGMSYARLPVSTAFHSQLIAPSAAPFAEYLEAVPFGTGGLPVYANLTGEPYPEDPALVREYLVQQMVNPVKFTEQIRHMVASGVRLFIEVGPDKVLTGLVQRILRDGDVEAEAISLDRKGEPGIAALWQTLAQLSVWGIPLTFAGLWEGFRTMEEPPFGEKPGFHVNIGGVNYGKPYPANKATTIHNDRQVMKVETNHQPQQRQQTQAIDQANSSQGRPTNAAAFMQQQMTEAHLAFQKALTESHHAYLRSTEKMLAALSGQPLESEPAVAASNAFEYGYDARSWDVGRNDPLPDFAAPVLQTAAAQAVRTQPAQVVDMPPPIVQASYEPAVPAAPPESANERDLNAIILDVVADKTGYPQQMVDMDIDLESGLGIDSIKRVEILSAVQDEVAGLPEFDPAEMASLRTLNEIARFMEDRIKKNGHLSL
ncbi:MAG: acyltransferase domain-containing protein [Paenibacillaceae bacterium]|nr:acyltransferase domain-containing protein [Paenibacillaceae bacterium]